VHPGVFEHETRACNNLSNRLRHEQFGPASSAGGDDTLDGGTGKDFVSYFFSCAAVTVSLTTGTATGEGTDTIANVEDVEGSRQADSITGNAGPNVFWGASGDDTIDGSTGVDTVSYEFSQTGVTATLPPGQ
jgi:Ca2+-binding RTX toxin-like protein